MSELNTENKESPLSNTKLPSGGAFDKRRPIPGRGHFKSRKGCFSCKRRRVKCSEELPACRGCGRLGLDCQYPRPSPVVLAPSRISHQPHSPLRLEDLRFFHHFLTAAYPSIPVGMDDIWQTVAAMSHEYEFLAHAILGLAAQHLTTSTASDFSVRALDHRISAISALNQALSCACPTQSDADAKFAAAIILTYQSSCMPDGMMDFLGMLRGWMVIQTTVVPSMGASIFHGVTEEAYIKSMRTLLGPAAGLEVDVNEKPHETLEDCLASLHLVAPLCQSSAELCYLACLERVARLGQMSPIKGKCQCPPFCTIIADMIQGASSSSPSTPRRTT